VVAAEVAVDSICKPSASGDVVCSWRTGMPFSAARMTSLKICAGNEPPVTERPCTLLIGLVLA